MILDVIKLSLWNKGDAVADWESFWEMNKHALTALPTDILSSLTMPEDLRRTWQLEIYQQISFNVNYQHEQELLPITVPYVILKGTSVAKYYPHPEYRAMGDIDIMTRREDFEAACEMLLDEGFRDITCEAERIIGRHRQFSKDGIEVEVHASYCHQNDPEKARLLDDLIIDNIQETHELPDMINGLVLLEHINHHMESGLGLRQIIDWMMFVDKCLPDEKWSEFQALAQQTGHEKLAIITTRMCELYLGLSEHHFCAQANPVVCEQLMEYILINGNFGRKQVEDSRVSQRFLSSARTFKGTIRYLQGRGLIIWKAAQKYRFLRPFAWIHQAFRYLKKGLQRKDSFTKLKTEREIARKRNELFDALDIAREDKGIVRYRNGKYEKV